MLKKDGVHSWMSWERKKGLIRRLALSSLRVFQELSYAVQLTCCYLEEASVQNKADSMPATESQKELEMTRNTNDTENLDFLVSPINQEEQQKFEEKERLCFFGSKNNPKYQDPNQPTSDGARY